jgi:hypothetical protein
VVEENSREYSKSGLKEDLQPLTDSNREDSICGLNSIDIDDTTALQQLSLAASENTKFPALDLIA